MNPQMPPPMPPMIPAVKGLTRSRARNCLLLNQLATPGLGSVLGGRWLAGGLQLAVAIVGFGLFMVWFLWTIKDYYGLIAEGAGQQPVSHAQWAIAGAAVMLISWCWSGVTSISMLREAAANESRAAQAARQA